MTTESRIGAMYAAFNARDVDGALGFMSETVSWPRASEGGRVEGKEEIRAYWGRQWKEFDPKVTPVEVVEEGAKVAVRVHQVVKSLAGEVLFDGEVWHVYTMAGGLMERMEIGGSEEQGVSGAFRRE